jgi:hypothetical protein
MPALLEAGRSRTSLPITFSASAAAQPLAQITRRLWTIRCQSRSRHFLQRGKPRIVKEK